MRLRLLHALGPLLQCLPGHIGAAPTTAPTTPVTSATLNQPPAPAPAPAKALGGRGLLQDVPNGSVPYPYPQSPLADRPPGAGCVSVSQASMERRQCAVRVWDACRRWHATAGVIAMLIFFFFPFIGLAQLLHAAGYGVMLCRHKPCKDSCALAQRRSAHDTERLCRGTCSQGRRRVRRLGRVVPERVRQPVRDRSASRALRVRQHLPAHRRRCVPHTPSTAGPAMLGLL